MSYRFNIIVGSNILECSSMFDAICIPTNGIVKNDGSLVMGAGAAKQFLNKYPDIDLILGRKVKEFGNHVYHVLTVEEEGQELHILSFPTKFHYRDDSDIALIESSAKRLLQWVDANDINKVALPSPGTGLGRLSIEDVYEVLDKYFDERFSIMTL